MGKTVSIVDVAEHAGVSVSTVSLVMNNRPNVAPGTAEAVWRSVKALGYRPGGANGKKRGPKPGPRKRAKTPQILLLQTGYPPAFFRRDIHAALLHGFLDAARRHLATLVLAHANEPGEACDCLRRSNCDGVLLLGRVEDGKLRDGLRRVPCVQAMGVLPENIGWDHVTYDQRGVVRSAAGWFMERGHSRCVLIGLDPRTAAETEALFSLEMKQRNGTVRCVCARDSIDLNGIFPCIDAGCFKSLFDSSPGKDQRATAVFLGSELLAGPLYRTCRTHGLQPGRDLDVVCAALRGPILEAAEPLPAIIDIHPEQVGQQAFDQILWRIEHCNEPSVTRLIAPSAVLTE